MTGDNSSKPIPALLAAAIAVRANAYVPYSGYHVGAALKGLNGKIYTGVNVGNAAYPEGTCAEAGAAQCQIVSSNIYDDGRGSVSANVQLRASPAWVATFQSGLDASLEAAGGRIQNQSQAADDLTSAIYDMEARLEAKRVLRTRLIALLERENASVEELVQVERELANVQGEIEGAEAQIRVMRGRVSMSALGLKDRKSVV